MTENTEKPNSLVRFYGKPKHAYSCIANNQLSLGHVENFNDPFDPIVNFIVEFETYNQLLDWIKENKQHRKFQSFKNKELTREQFNRVFENVREHILKFMYAACFFANNNIKEHPDDLYMWGHYANGHRGIAIKFDTGKMGKKCNDALFEIDYSEDGLSEIKYEEFYNFIVDRKKHEQIIFDKYKDNLKMKSESWSRENEWRLLMTPDDKPKFPLPRIEESLSPNSISAIYLGCIINEKCKDLIMRLAKKYQPNAKIYQAKKHLKKLEITFEEIGK